MDSLRGGLTRAAVDAGGIEWGGGAQRTRKGNEFEEKLAREQRGRDDTHDCAGVESRSIYLWQLGIPDIYEQALEKSVSCASCSSFFLKKNLEAGY